MGVVVGNSAAYPLKFGESFGHLAMPIPSQARIAVREGVETRRAAPKAGIGHGGGIVQTTNISLGDGGESRSGMKPGAACSNHAGDTNLRESLARMADGPP